MDKVAGATEKLTDSEELILRLASLYDQDFVAWTERMAQALERRDFSALDLENLIEEVQDLGKRDKRDVESDLYILLTHLLKWQYQPSCRSYPGTKNEWYENSWPRTISEHRRRIRKFLKDSPSLRKVLIEELDDSYTDARKEASQQTGLDINVFPGNCEYTQEQILDDDFWPGPKHD